jgi:hypothetical protein
LDVIVKGSNQRLKNTKYRLVYVIKAS